MNNPLLERLAAGGILISDGATGTFLHAKGLKPGRGLKARPTIVPVGLAHFGP